MNRNKQSTQLFLGLNTLLTPRRKKTRAGFAAELTFETFEPRMVFSADVGMQFTELNLEPAASVIAGEQPVADDFGLDEAFFSELDRRQAALERFAIDTLNPAVNRLRVPVVVDGEQRVLQLEQALTTRADNFGVLLQVGDGSFTEFQVDTEGSFVGQVEGLPGLQVRAVVSSRGLSAEVLYEDGRLAWTISPTDQQDAQGRNLHIADSTDVYALLEANHDHDGDGVADHGAHEHGPPHPPGCSCPACCGTGAAAPQAEIQAFEPPAQPQQEIQQSQNQQNPANTSSALVTSNITSPPPTFGPDGRVLVPNNPASRAVVTTPVEVRRAVIGFDVSNESFREAYNNNVQAVLDNIALFLITDERISPATVSPNTVFLRDGLVQQVAGLIIIRTDAASDPYADASGDTDVNTENLLDFRDRWNSNADLNNANLTLGGETNRSQSDHSLVTLLAGGGGTADGLGFVGTINQFNRYSISDGARPDFWRSVARHEIGHNYGLLHFGDDDRRAEFDPAGNGIGIFDPMGLRNALTTDEREVVRAEVLSSNLPLINAGTPDAGTFTDHQVRPNALRDDVVLTGTSLTIDVLANDSDANNDALFIQRFDGTTEQGGTVRISIGTGNQGQDELIYTPPSGFTGEDSFFYFAGEAVSGPQFTSFGLVTIDVPNAVVFPTTVDPDQDIFFYDIGTPDSPVFSNGVDPYQRLSENTFGDLGFEILPNSLGIELESRDREANGPIPGVNDINRDHIRIRSDATFRHILSDGLFDITVTVGDATENTAPIRFTAEDSVTLTTASHSPADHTTYFLRNVLVTDGELNIDIENLGFSANITRFIIERVGEGPTTVDPSQGIFFYDIGTSTSPIFTANSDPYQRLSEQTFGDLGLSSSVPGAITTVDREANGQIGNVNNINRDLVRLTADSSFRHLLDDGIFDIRVTVGDVAADSDALTLTAEGDFVTTTVSQAASTTFVNYDIRNVVVEDGELNLEIAGVNGADFEASLTRFIITRVGDLPEATVVSRQLFYNDSAFDNTSDDDAIAIDKQALLPGQTATFANYSSFPLGINGIIIDATLANPTAFSSSDILLARGAGNELSDFTALSVNASITVRPGEGVDGSDRITVILPNGSVVNEYLQVSVLANANTGLANDDVFYFGNVVGDTGDLPNNTIVNVADQSGVRANLTAFQAPGIDNPFDINRDGVVNVTDDSVIGANLTAFVQVPLITAPAAQNSSNLTNALTSLISPPAVVEPNGARDFNKVEITSDTAAPGLPATEPEVQALARQQSPILEQTSTHEDTPTPVEIPVIEVTDQIEVTGQAVATEVTAVDELSIDDLPAGNTFIPSVTQSSAPITTQVVDSTDDAVVSTTEFTVVRTLTTPQSFVSPLITRSAFLSAASDAVKQRSPLTERFAKLDASTSLREATISDKKRSSIAGDGSFESKSQKQNQRLDKLFADAASQFDELSLLDDLNSDFS